MEKLEPKPQLPDITPEFRQLVFAMNRFTALGETHFVGESMYEASFWGIDGNEPLGQARSWELSVDDSTFKCDFVAFNEMAGMANEDGRKANGAIRLGDMQITGGDTDAYIVPWSDGEVYYNLAYHKPGDPPEVFFSLAKKLGIPLDNLVRRSIYQPGHPEYEAGSWSECMGEQPAAGMQQLADTINDLIIDSLPSRFLE